MIDREGLDRFSVRRLAERLGVTPMAVYNHVKGRQDLLEAVAGAVLDSVKYPVATGDWRKVVATCFRRLRNACLAHSAAVPLIEAADSLPASIFRPMEITLTALHRAGLGLKDAARVYFLLTTFTVGQVKGQTKGWARGVDRDSALDDGRISAREFPAVAASATGGPWDFDGAFEFGLTVILRGVEAELRRR